MSRKSQEGKMRIVSEEGGRAGRFGRFVVTTLIVAVILLGTVFFAARSEGGRSLAEDWLGDKVGMKVKAAESSVGWPYDLVLRDLVTEGFEDERNGGMRVDRVRIGLFGKAFLRVQVDGGEIRLVRGSETGWDPARLRQLGDLPDAGVGGVSSVTRGLRQKLTLRAAGCSIRWLAQDGAELASAGGVSLLMAPVRFPGGRMYYYQLEVYNVLEPDGTRTHNVRREWLASEVEDYIEINRRNETPQRRRGFFGESALAPAKTAEAAIVEAIP